jgi:hypothetical protein
MNLILSNAPTSVLRLIYKNPPDMRKSTMANIITTMIPWTHVPYAEISLPLTVPSNLESTLKINTSLLTNKNIRKSASINFIERYWSTCSFDLRPHLDSPIGVEFIYITEYIIYVAKKIILRWLIRRQDWV